MSDCRYPPAKSTELWRLRAKPDAEVLAAEIGARVRELVSGRWGNRSGRDGRVSRPTRVSPNRLVTDGYIRMARDRPGVLGDFGGSIVVVVERVGQIGAANIVQLDFETVAFDASVVNRVEIVDRAVSNAGAVSRHSNQQEDGKRSHYGA